MTPREQRLDRLLAELRLSQDSISAAQLAKILHVSTRSIREYVHDLNHRASAAIIVSSQNGYQLDQRAYQRYRARQAEQKVRLASGGDRTFVILDRLLRGAGSVDVFDLAEQLGYSEATVEADLGRVRQVARDFEVRLVRRGDHLLLEGLERDKRRLFRSVLTRDKSPDKGAVPTQAVRELEDVQEAVADALAGVGLEVNDYVLRDLALHVTIAADRVASGNALPSEKTGAMEQPFDEAVTALAAMVRQTRGIELPFSEKTALGVVLGARLGGRQGDGLDPAVEAFVRESIDEVAKQYLLEMGDESSVIALTFHVQALIHRARVSQQVAPPLVTGFKTTHPLIHEVSLFFAHRIERFADIHVGASEIDYLSFHLGSRFRRLLHDGPPVRVILVVPGYGPGSRDRDRRLRHALAGTATLVGVFEPRGPWREESFDLVVTVEDLSDTTDAIEVRISPLLTQVDVDAILSAVRDARRGMNRQHLRSALLELLRPSLYRRTSALTQTDTIRLLAGDLAEQGVVDETFEIDVLDRERRSSTNFGGRFAIPHSLFMDANETAIAILTTPDEIPWPETPVQMVAMFAVSHDSREVFRDAIDEMNRVFQDPRAVSRLVAAGSTYEGFVRHLIQLLDH